MSDKLIIKLPTPEEQFELGRRARAERLRLAQTKLSDAKEWLFNIDVRDEVIEAACALIDAKVELALLEREL